MKAAAELPPLDVIFAPVQSQTALEETLERLGTAIKLGLLEPGSRLPAERELCTRLAISRSTLRQALTTLVQSGHLVSVRGRSGGTFVADEPPLGQTAEGEVLTEDARAVLDYRVAVETGATVLAAERALEQDLERLLEWTERMDAAGPFDEYRRADVRFQRILVRRKGDRTRFALTVMIVIMVVAMVVIVSMTTLFIRLVSGH